MIDPAILKARRTRMRLSLEKLATKAGLSKSQIHKIEKGDGGRPNERTISLLAKALGLTEKQLAGNAPIEEEERSDPYEPRRSSVTFRMTVGNRNALYLVARRYKVPAPDILEIAPLMFQILAGLSLNARREALAEVRQARDGYEALHRKVPHLGREATETWQNSGLLDGEERSIAKLDVLGRELFAEHLWTRHDAELDDEPNPFIRFLAEALKSLPEELGWGGEIGDWTARPPSYTICEAEMAEYCEGDQGLVHGLRTGLIGLHEIPQELRQEGRSQDRLEWLRARCSKANRELEHFHIEC